MGTAANEVEIFVTSHAVVGAEVEHLVEGVGKVEGGSHEDVEFVSPAIGGDDLFGDDVLTEVFHARAFFDTVEDFFAVFLFLLFPVEAVAAVDGGDKNIEPGLSGGGDVRVGDGGVADVDGHVVGDDAFALDVVDVVLVVVGEDDVVVGFVVVDFVEPKVEHEGGAGVFLFVEFFLGDGPSVHE